jgi:GNAT superfamily N-acetyltransferase
VPTVHVTRTYLELRDPSRFRAARLDPARERAERVRVERVSPCPVALYRTLYRDVGASYYWRDRDSWSDDRLNEYLARDDVSVWLLRVGDDTAGYFELVTGADGATEIAYFGLVAPFIGRGLGKHLLTCAVEEAWRGGASRVWLHTCTLDDPAALPNYRARGFEQIKTEVYETQIPGD